MTTDLRSFLVDALATMNYDTDGLTGDTPIGDDGVGLESLGIAELAMRVEETYGTTFPEDDSEKIVQMTFDDLVAYLSGIVAAPAGEATA